MTPQATAALVAALLGLAGCTDKELADTIAALKGDDASQEAKIYGLQTQLALYAQSSSSQAGMIQPPTAGVEVAAEPSAVEPDPAPLTEPCDQGTSQFRLWTCDATGHRSYI